MRCILSTLGGWTLLFAVTFPATAAQPPPISAFTDRAEVSDVRISPTGRYIAAAMRDGEAASFRIITNPEREQKVHIPLGDKREIANFAWAADDVLLVTAARRFPGYDFTARTGELMTINAETGHTKRVGAGELLSILPDDPGHILVTASADRFGEAHRLNLKSRHMSRVARSAVPRASFVHRADGSIAFSIGETVDNQAQIHYRERGNKWALVESYGLEEAGWRPIWFGPQPHTFFTSDQRGGSTVAIGLYDVKAKTHKSLVQHPQVDHSSLLRDYHGRVYGVRFDHHYPGFVYLDRAHPLTQQHASLVKMFPNDTVTFTSFTRDHDQAIVLVSGDHRPGDFMLVDAEAQKVETLLSRRPALQENDLSPMAGVEFDVSDGKRIYGYLTSPPSAKKPGPMVVYVHGGPIARDYWGFDSIAQLFASRGFHVLQVNYRGSSGYGLDYMKSGFGEWGRRIEDDVADAARWAVRSDIAASGRICIYGTSYGAFSALIGAARNPDLYRCAIGGAGIYDLTLLEKTGDMRQRRAGLAYLRQVVGDDLDALKDRSPVHLADRIKAAVMLYHGGGDRRAPPAHAHAMRAALVKSGRQPEWLFDADQGHGFFGNEPRRLLHERILAFLGRHIGG